MRRHDFAGRHSTGHRHQPQLPCAADDLHVDVRRDDVLGASLGSQLHQFRCGDRTGAYQHPSLVFGSDFGYGVGRHWEGVWILLIESDLHQPDSTFIQGVRHLHTLFRIDAADDGDDLLLFYHLDNLFSHSGLHFSYYENFYRIMISKHIYISFFLSCQSSLFIKFLSLFCVKTIADL